MRMFGLGRKESVVFFVATAVFISFFASLSLGSSEASGGGGVSVLPDGSIFIQLVNFLFTIWMLNLILYRPIRNILSQRKEKIERLALTIETYGKDAAEKDEAFASGIKAARAKGLNEKEALLQSASEKEKKIIEGVNKKAQADLAEIREKIARDTENVLAVLEDKIDEFAYDICRKILGRAF